MEYYIWTSLKGNEHNDTGKRKLFVRQLEVLEGGQVHQLLSEKVCMAERVCYCSYCMRVCDCMTGRLVLSFKIA